MPKTPLIALTHCSPKHWRVEEIRGDLVRVQNGDWINFANIRQIRLCDPLATYPPEERPAESVRML